MATLEKYLQVDFPRHALRGLLRPIVRLCLRYSVNVQEVVEDLKRVFVEEGVRELEESGSKVSDSRVSVFTGVHRGEVKRLRVEEPDQDSETNSVLTKVVGQWLEDPHFLNKGGKPRVLTYDGPESEFADLVRSVNTCYGAGTVLLELLRIGTVVKTKNGLKLRRKMLGLADDAESAYLLLSKDFATLTQTVQNNIDRVYEHSSLHIRTEYDNVLVKEVPKIRKWVLDEGKKFHQRVRDYVSKRDRDVNLRLSSDEPAGAKIVVTAFGFSSEPAGERVDSED